jgi:hypothetical protein
MRIFQGDPCALFGAKGFLPQPNKTAIGGRSCSALPKAIHAAVLRRLFIVSPFLGLWGGYILNLEAPYSEGARRPHGVNSFDRCVLVELRP